MEFIHRLNRLLHRFIYSLYKAPSEKSFYVNRERVFNTLDTIGNEFYDGDFLTQVTLEVIYVVPRNVCDSIEAFQTFLKSFKGEEEKKTLTHISIV